MQAENGANGSTHSKKAAKPAEKPAVPTVSDPFSALQAVDLTGIKLPANVMLSNAASSVVLGNRYETSLSLSGIVRRIRWVIAAGYVVFDVEQTDKVMRHVVITGSGMESLVAEDKGSAIP